MRDSRIKKNIKTKQDSLFFVNTDSKGNVITQEIETVSRINNDCVVRLAGKIQDRSRVEVILPEGLSETKNIDDIGVDQYYVNYDYGVLIFNKKRIGEYSIVKAKCIGQTFLSDSKIFTEINNNGDVIETINDLIGRNERFFALIKDANELVELNEQIKVSIDSANAVHKKIFNDIVEGTALDDKLVEDIQNAKETNVTLNQTNSNAKEINSTLNNNIHSANDIHEKLQSEIPTGSDLYENLKNSISNGQKTKQELDDSISKGELKNYVRKDTLNSDVLNLLYPVGSIYISVSPNNPSDTMGGKWERFAHGKTLFGVDEDSLTFQRSQQTGGEAISSSLNVIGSSYGLSLETGFFSKRVIVAENRHVPQGESERSAEVSLLPSYVTVYMWKRTI